MREEFAYQHWQGGGGIILPQYTLSSPPKYESYLDKRLKPIQAQTVRGHSHQLFYAWRDKKMINAYINTLAMATLAIAEYHKCDHSLGFLKGSQKTLKFILNR